MDRSPFSPRGDSHWRTVASSPKLAAITYFSKQYRALRPDRKRGGRHQSKWEIVRRGARLVGAMDSARLQTRASTRSSVESCPVGDAQADWWDQGDAAMHNDSECWQARIALRKHGLVVEQLHRWWVHAHASYIGPFPPKGLVFEEVATTKPRGLTFGDYVDLQLRLYKCLVNPFNAADARACARQDWKTDCGGGNILDRIHFMDAIFEVADTWTRSIHPVEYAAFLHRLLDAVAEPDHCGGYKMRPLKNISFGEIIDDATQVAAHQGATLLTPEGDALPCSMAAASSAQAALADECARSAVEERSGEGKTRLEALGRKSNSQRAARYLMKPKRAPLPSQLGSPRCLPSRNHFIKPVTTHCTSSATPGLPDLVGREAGTVVGQSAAALCERNPEPSSAILTPRVVSLDSVVSPRSAILRMRPWERPPAYAVLHSDTTVAQLKPNGLFGSFLSPPDRTRGV